MKKISVILAILSVCILSACGEGEDNIEQQDSILETLCKYKWVFESENVDTDGMAGSYEKSREYLYFLRDGEGRDVWKTYYVDSDGYEDDDVNVYKTSYYVEGNQITVHRNDGSKGVFRLSENELINIGGNCWVGQTMLPQAINDADYRYIPKYGVCGETLIFKYDPIIYELSIEGSGDMYDYSPEETPWIELYIKKVVFADGVTSVGDYAFYTMRFEEVEMPKGLKRVGKGAFAGTFIKSIDLYEEVEEIGELAFSGCKYLSRLFISGEEVKIIGKAAFSGCEKLSVYLDDCIKLEEIGDLAFFQTYVGSFTPSQYLRSIGIGAFSMFQPQDDCLVLPASLETVSDSAFGGSIDIDEIIIRGSNTVFEGKCFAFSSARSGKLYVHSGNPPVVNDDKLIVIDNYSTDPIEYLWTLYVPKGCKHKYENESPWNKFGAIIEDSTLNPNWSTNEGNKGVVFNELCGNRFYNDNKYIELYNLGEETANLSGWTIRKYASDATDVDGLYDLVWTCPQGMNLASGDYLVLEADQTDPWKGFNAGLSAKKEIKFELVNADGVVVDKFVRGNDVTPFAEESLPLNPDASFSRIPNGTGPFVYAIPTPGAVNGEMIGEIEQYNSDNV